MPSARSWRLRAACSLVLVCFALAGCAQELTRDKAKAILQQGLSANPVRYEGLDGLRCAEALGLLKADFRGIRLTDTGSRYLSQLNWDSTMWDSKALMVSFVRPPVLTVGTIDGIADVAGAGGAVPSLKEVSFSVIYAFTGSEVSSEALPCFRPAGPGRGTATFRRYDDGWRLENASWSVPVDTSAANQAAAGATQKAAEAAEAARVRELDEKERSLASAGILARTAVDGVLLSTNTHLAWYAQAIPIEGKRFAELEGACRSISTPRYRGWRVANFQELMSITEPLPYGEIRLADVPDHRLLGRVLDLEKDHTTVIWSRDHSFYAGGSHTYPVLNFMAIGEGRLAKQTEIEPGPELKVMAARDRVLCVAPA